MDPDATPIPPAPTDPPTPPAGLAPRAPAAPVYLLPGWLDSGPGHWQTRWAQRHGDRRVLQDDWV